MVTLLDLVRHVEKVPAKDLAAPLLSMACLRLLGQVCLRYRVGGEVISRSVGFEKALKAALKPTVALCLEQPTRTSEADLSRSTLGAREPRGGQKRAAANRRRGGCRRPGRWREPKGIGVPQGGLGLRERLRRSGGGVFEQHRRAGLLR